MSSNAVMIADMGVLVGIFLLGLLAKVFPRDKSKQDPHR
jgi:hypothetical protein